MDNYITIYEISSCNYGNSIEHFLTIIAYIVFTIGFLLLSYTIYVNNKKQTSLEKYYAPLFFIIFSILIFILLSFIEDDYKNNVKEILSEEKYETIEGVVHVSHVQPKQGHTQGDIISIDNKTFEINFYKSKPGYKNTISHGGVLKEGVYARLYTYGDLILRVDISQKDVNGILVDTQSDNDVATTSIDISWMVGIVFVNLLFYFRKFILFSNGYGVSLVDFGHDHSRFEKIIINESSLRKQAIYRSINILIPMLFICSLILAIISFIEQRH